MLALDLSRRRRSARRCATFVAGGRPVIGICNGFQVLTRAGLLPGALGHNADGRFDCRWVELAAEPAVACVWTAGLDDADPLPDRPRRGPLRAPRPRRRSPPPARSRCATVGVNPNGSVADIAGVCDATGVVLGLMPHPENHVVARQHPRHRRDRRPSAPRPAPVRSGVASRTELTRCTPARSTPFIDIDLPLARPARRQGARVVRAAATDQRLFVTTDRLSAFDRIIAGVPYKGQVLNQLVGVVVRAHRRRRRQPRRRRARPERARSPAPPRRCRSRSSCAATSPASRRRRCGGSTPTARARSTATTSPTGCARTRRCPTPIVTPTTKAAATAVHDEPLTCAEVVERGLVDADAVGAGHGGRARAVPPRPARSPPSAGLILADTKYEFGVDRRRRAAADRRGAHARLVAVLGRRHLRRAARRRRGAGEPRQGGRAAGAAPTPATRGDGAPPDAADRRRGRPPRRATSTPTSGSPARRSSPAPTRSPSASHRRPRRQRRLL